ncbi:MAG: hypothetical protein HOI42_11125 [Candidatus Marinimicrobia bacterium]|jgi:hypothetical protein|nr:hypothetical protein [Candidatus Neomarinimicrobiota bacterium]
MFSKELEYFKLNQDDLVGKYQGNFLVIKDSNVVGVYQSALDAYIDSQEKYEVGTFMIQPCEPGPDAYTVTIASSIILDN